MNRKHTLLTAAAVLLAFSLINLSADDKPADSAPPKAFIDGLSGPGWVTLTGDDFERVNCDDDTWTWDGGVAHCTGIPVGVTRTKKQVANFEMSIEWMHLRSAGNSGVFVWSPEATLTGLERGKLPGGIEVQMLDHGYAENYKEKNGKDSDWFSTNGDVFPVGGSKLTPFPPLSADGSRSFPSKNLSKGFGHWNHYYIRAINGEVRLWVNGEEVSGGTGSDPKTGYLCLESEGSPITFRNIRLRELP